MLLRRDPTKMDKICTYNDVHDHFSFTLAKIASEYYREQNYCIQEKCTAKITRQYGIEQVCDELKDLFGIDKEDIYYSSDDSDYEYYRRLKAQGKNSQSSAKTLKRGKPDD